MCNKPLVFILDLVSKVVPQDQLMEVATEMASKIASFSKPVGEYPRSGLILSIDFFLTR